jgi:hypothetical protein
MQAVESIVNLAVSAGNTAISSYNIKGQIMSAGIQAMSPGPGVSGQQQGTAHQVQIPTPGASTSPAGVPTLPTTQALTDPAVLEIPKTLALANALLLLLTVRISKATVPHVSSLLYREVTRADQTGPRSMASVYTSCAPKL